MLTHPLNANRRGAALWRYAWWQLRSRLARRPIEVPWIPPARLLVRSGMRGATGCIYCGLPEFEDMAFVLHCLRPGDLFVDVGANVGTYTVLAGAVVGADVIACEPVPRTHAWLEQNIELNGLQSRVVAHRCALSGHPGRLRFTTGLDAVNHVVTAGETALSAMHVDVRTLDEVVAERQPTLIKIDVEGYETEVIAGGQESLGRETLLAVILEMNGSGARYGFDESALHERMLGAGFKTYRYMPLERRLDPCDGGAPGKGNALYLRQPKVIAQRIQSARRFGVNGVEL